MRSGRIGAAATFEGTHEPLGLPAVRERADTGVYAGPLAEQRPRGGAVGDVDVVDLLGAVERLIADHSDELDILNVFPVPDADTGRNVLATVHAARAGAEQAPAAERTRAAVRGAVTGARGNAGVLVSQLLRALVEEGPAGGAGSDWPARLARADELARAAVAHPVEGSLLTAVRAAATAAAEHTEPGAQLAAAVAAAHAAVRDSPTQLEVLARAGVVDAGARAAALVLEAVAAVVSDTVPAPPAVEIPPGGPRLTTCAFDDAAFEVMYLLDPADQDVVGPVRRGLDRIGSSVVVVAADRLVSVHVHTDDIGAALGVGLDHGRPHDVRVEDLHQQQRDAAGHAVHVGQAPGLPGRAGLVVGTAGGGLARLAGQAGATTMPLTGRPPSQDDLRIAVLRTGATRVVVLPGDPRATAVADDLDLDGVEVVVVAAADGPARVLAALAVADPTSPDATLLSTVAEAVRSGEVRRGQEGSWIATVGTVRVPEPTPMEACGELLRLLDEEGPVELVSVLWGLDADVALRDAVVEAVEGHWPDAAVDLVDAGLEEATVVVGVE